MKNALSALILMAATGTAAAHEGHIAPMAGHSHGEILAAVIAVFAVGLYALSRRA